MATTAIEVSHLTKVFGGRVAVEDVSFSVARGEVFGFLGPNGAGKTTTVRILGTLIAPTSGAATVAGVPLTRANEAEVRQRISIMPEAPGLYRRLTVTENLEFFARLYGVPHRRVRITEALAAVGISDRAQDVCGSLSKGLRQRVALARTLLNDPEVMFLDEPTSGLDPVAAHEVHDLINSLRERGVTVFPTTHRLDEAERLCDRVAIMNTHLRTIGRPDELRQTLFSRSLAVTTAAPLADPDQVFTGRPAVQSWRADDRPPGDRADDPPPSDRADEPPPSDRADDPPPSDRADEPPPNGRAGYVLAVSDPALAAPEVTRALVAAGADVLSIAESRHTLEDVYLQLIDDDEGRPR
jgi:ABC-2 type transport system ATP-binding protein